MLRRILVTLEVFLLIATALPQPIIAADQQQWGDLKGRFVFDGEPPKPVKLAVNKDQDHVKGTLFDESLLVDAKTKGIANVLVHLLPAKGETLPVHSDYETATSGTVKATIINFRFEPHVIIARTGQTLEITSKDNVGHSPKIDFFSNQSFSDIIPSGRLVKRELPKAEAHPCPICYRIHPWENARILVLDHPYAVLTSSTGEFTLKNLPVGIRSFRIWQESCGFVSNIRRGDDKLELKKGRIELEIKPGRNDLGDILVPTVNLKK